MGLLLGDDGTERFFLCKLLYKSLFVYFSLVSEEGSRSLSAASQVKAVRTFLVVPRFSSPVILHSTTFIAIFQEFFGIASTPPRASRDDCSFLPVEESHGIRPVVRF